MSLGSGSSNCAIWGTAQTENCSNYRPADELTFKFGRWPRCPARQLRHRTEDRRGGRRRGVADTVREVVVRGPNVMIGYWKQPEQTAAALRNGWMHSGDGACMDDGFNSSSIAERT